jgi:hypothetical protein
MTISPTWGAFVRSTITSIPFADASANHRVALDLEKVGRLLVLDQILIEAHGVDQLFLGRGGEAGFDNAEQRHCTIGGAGMSFP